MIKIAICDDEKFFADYLHSILDNSFKELCKSVEFFVFYDPLKMAEYMTFGNFDVVFLDIDMPCLSGFDIAKKICNTPNQKTKIIFISAMYDLVYESFEYQPFYFIKKGSEDVMIKDIQHLCKKIVNIFKINFKINVNICEQGIFELFTEDILYIKSEKHYIIYYLTCTDHPLKERTTIAQKKKELSSMFFVQSHQRFLVNMNHIVKVDLNADKIFLSDEKILPISKSFKAEFLKEYRLFKRGTILC
ncbi:MAG: response regulator transcription factor [Clostridia bacterium]|nr:response regulator transcription factor [Clostridia bacterium]